MTTMMTDQQLQQKFKDLCEDGLWTIFETKETKVPERTALAHKECNVSTLGEKKREANT